MSTDLKPPATADRSRSRTPWLVGAAVVGVLAVAVGASVLGSDDNTAPDADAVTLSLPTGDPALQSCLALSDSVPVLAGLPTAFAGTVTTVSGGRVALEVERWYTTDRGGTVVLADAPEQQQALLGATDFAVGDAYLVSAGADGVVSVCGLTGPAGPELQAAYEQAFG